MKPKNGIKAFAVNALTTIGAVLLAFFVLETAIRALVAMPSPYPLDTGLLVLDQRGFWLNRPGLEATYGNKADFSGKSLTIRDDGTRTVPCRSNDGPGQGSGGVRVYLLGDSQTFGHGLSDEETWANHLQCQEQFFVRAEGAR